MGTFGRYAGKLRRAAADFQRQFDEAMRDTEVAEVKKAMESVRAEAASLDQPVMLPKIDTPASPTPQRQSTPPCRHRRRRPRQRPPATAETKPKPPRKRAASTKPKSGSPKRSQEACGAAA